MILKELEYLYHKIPDYKITEHLNIKHPTYREIIEYGEDRYISLLYRFCTMPYDYKSELFDMGVNWYEIDDLEWFYQLFHDDCNIIFTEDIRDYMLYMDRKTEKIILYNPFLDERLNINHIKLIKEHINSMIGDLYKEHKEIPKNNTTKKLLIELDEKEKYYNRNKEKYIPTIKDIISNVLMNKLYEEDPRIIKQTLNLHFYDEYSETMSISAFRLGEIDMIKKFSDEIYKELAETI